MLRIILAWRGPYLVQAWRLTALIFALALSLESLPAADAPANVPAGAAEPVTDPLLPPVAIDERTRERAQKYHDRVNLADYEHDTKPVFSLLVTSVTPLQAAARAGIEVGDRIVRLNGTLLQSADQYTATVPKKGDYTITVWSPRRGEKEYKFNGLIGINFKDCWETQMAYIHSADRDPAWDAWMIVACEGWEDRHAVASAALEEARKAGYRGYLLPAMRLCLACQAGWYDAALAAAKKLPDDIPFADRRTIYYHEFMASVFLSHIEAAMEIHRTHPELYLSKRNWLPNVLINREMKLTSEVRGWIQHGRLLQDPIKDHSTDFTTTFEQNAAAAAGLKDKKTVSLTSENHTPVTYALGPITDAALFGLDVKFDLSAKRAPIGNCRLALVDPASGVPVMVLVLYSTGEISVISANYPSVRFDSEEGSHKGGTNRYEFTTVGPYCELWLNDHVLGRALVDTTAKSELVPVIAVDNMTVELSNLVYKRLKPPPTPAAAAPPPAKHRPVAGLAPAPPAPADPVDRWFFETYVGTYLKAGHRDPAWDAEVLAALTQYAQGERYSTHTKPLYDTWKRLDKAIQQGCDDPLVRVIAASIYQFAIDGDDLLPCLRAHKNMLDWLQQPTTPALPYLEFVEQTYLFEQDRRSGFPIIQERAKERLKRLTALLAPLLSAPPPPSEIRHMLTQLLTQPMVKNQDRMELFGDFLDELKKRAPDTSLAHYIEGRMLLRYAWDGRGDGAEIEVTADGHRLFETRLTQAAKLLDRAWALDKTNVDAMIARMAVGMGLGESVEQLDHDFDLVMALDPNSTDAYNVRARALLPRWGGSHELIAHFTRQAQLKVKQNTQAYDPLLALLVVDMHEYFAREACQAGNDAEEINRIYNDYWLKPGVWLDVHASYELALKRNPHDQWILTKYIYSAAQCHQWHVVDRLTDQLHGEVCYVIFGGRAAFSYWYSHIKPMLKAAEDAAKLPPPPVQPRQEDDVF